MLYYRCACPKCAVVMYQHCAGEQGLRRDERLACLACGHRFVVLIRPSRADAVEEVATTACKTAPAEVEPGLAAPSRHEARMRMTAALADSG